MSFGTLPPIEFGKYFLTKILQTHVQSVQHNTATNTRHISTSQHCSFFTVAVDLQPAQEIQQFANASVMLFFTFDLIQSCSIVFLQ